MMLPGYGCCVNGFLMAVLTSEKLPCRISAVGTETNALDSDSARTPAGRGEQVRRRVDAVERQAVLDFALARTTEAQTDVAVVAAENPRRRARQAPDVASGERQLDDRTLLDRF